jgi:hypothetical protein
MLVESWQSSASVVIVMKTAYEKFGGVVKMLSSLLLVLVRKIILDRGIGTFLWYTPIMQEAGKMVLYLTGEQVNWWWWHRCVRRA